MIHSWDWIRCSAVGLLVHYNYIRGEPTPAPDNELLALNYIVLEISHPQ